MTDLIPHPHSRKLPILAFICASLIGFTLWASPTQAYTGHAGCPNANAYQLVACAWHTNWRWFSIYTHNHIHIWAGPYDRQCGPGWCSIDKGYWGDGRASYYNGDSVAIWGMNAYYYQSL